LKVVFITTGHSPLDDRIYYHQAMSLVKRGCIVHILSSWKEFNQRENNLSLIGFNGNIISKKDKIQKFLILLENIIPDSIICSEPLAVFAAYNYKKKCHSNAKIIYDITEWYPSKKNLVNSTGLKKIYLFIKLACFNIYTSSKCNSFIFGEFYKSLPYKIIFPFKKSVLISYFPDLKYINHNNRVLFKNNICLGYTGQLSKDKGCFNFTSVIKELNNKFPQLNIDVKIIGWFPNHEIEEEFRNTLTSLNINKTIILDYQEFLNFNKEIKDIDIFFDLREIDIENSFCLPIKLFYYMACGRPVIYSNLNAIKKVINVNDFGLLINPRKFSVIADFIIAYINDNDKYNKHCLKARSYSQNKFNWNSIEHSFINFICN
jgi:glycosyltransferase involved in cell wall biosynthesis